MNQRPVGDDPLASRDIAFDDREVDLPVIPANGIQLAALTEVVDRVTRSLVDFPFEERQVVVAVQVDLPGLAVGLVALLDLLDDVGHAGSMQEGGQPVFVRDDVIVDRAGLDHAGPTDDQRHAEAAFPGRALLAVERCDAAIGPTPRFRAVVGAVDHDRVVVDSEFLQLVQEQADVAIMFHHAVGIESDTSLPLRFLLQSRPDVHARRAHPDKEGLLCLVARSMKSRPAAANSSSAVSIRFWVKGPVSWMRPSA